MQRSNGHQHTLLSRKTQSPNQPTSRRPFHYQLKCSQRTSKHQTLPTQTRTQHPSHHHQTSLQQTHLQPTRPQQKFHPKTMQHLHARTAILHQSTKHHPPNTQAPKCQKSLHQRLSQHSPTHYTQTKNHHNRNQQTHQRHVRHIQQQLRMPISQYLQKRLKQNQKSPKKPNLNLEPTSNVHTSRPNKSPADNAVTPVILFD